MSALALRKPELAMNFLIVNNRWTEAMLISRLQDSKFRQLSPQKFSGVHEQFETVFSNKTSKLAF